MSICSGIGNGIGGAIGKWGAGLGSALGLGAIVDLGTKAYTGYGLLETLNVPYIECSNGSFATAIEWYGSGLKCPKKPESTQLGPTQGSRSQSDQALDYDAIVASLGGYTGTYWGCHSIDTMANIMSGPYGTRDPKINPGFPDLMLVPSDEFGNVWPGNYQEGSNGISDGWGSNTTHGWRNSSINVGVFQGGFRDTKSQTRDFAYILKSAPYKILGVIAIIPNPSEAPPAANPVPPPGFAPNPPSPPEDCEMSCPCLSPQEIEKIIKKALGIMPFSPEKLVRELGTKIYAAPGPSVVPVVPTSLVEAIAGLIATVYMRAGYGRYPVMMPNSLINDDGTGDAIPTEGIENFAEWFEWHIKQQDAIQGEWPIDITIVDGAKRQPLKFENISEAFAEMTGLLIQTATDADAAVSTSSHAAVAATKAQTAAIIAQKNVECLIKFFGVRTGYGSIFVDAVITPMDTDSSNFNLKKFLTPSKQSVAFYTDDDPFDFQAVLDRILRNSEISKASVAMDASKGLVGDYARNQRKYDLAESKREAEKDLEKLQNSINAKNPEFKVKIKVETPIATTDVTGSNFVIKRPKTSNE